MGGVADSPRLRAHAGGRARALRAQPPARARAPGAATTYDFVCPSMGTYPFQWFWDSCFHAVALAHFDPERARTEVRSLLKNAAARRLRGPRHLLAARGLRGDAEDVLHRLPHAVPQRLHPAAGAGGGGGRRRRRGEGGGRFLDEVLPKVRRYFDWLRPRARSRSRRAHRHPAAGRVRPRPHPEVRRVPRDHGHRSRGLHGGLGPRGRTLREVGRDPEKMFALDRFVVRGRARQHHLRREPARARRSPGVAWATRAGASEMRRALRGTRPQALVAKCYDRGGAASSSTSPARREKQLARQHGLVA